MEHIGSISGHFMALYDNWKVDYIGRLEQYERHWKILSLYTPECGNGYLDLYWQRAEERKKRIARIRRRLNQNEESAKRKNVLHIMHHTGQHGKHTLGRILVDAYYAIAANKETYALMEELKAGMADTLSRETKVVAAISFPPNRQKNSLRSSACSAFNIF